jgi:hypothetical protein
MSFLLLDWCEVEVREVEVREAEMRAAPIEGCIFQP